MSNGLNSKKFYYGLVDAEANAYGFIDEDDSRRTEDFIELSYLQWKNLLDEQSEGKKIVMYNGEVFTAERDKYYLDETGWHERTDEEVEEIREAERKAARIAELKAELEEIDSKAVRPLRAIVSGTDTEYDHTKLDELEAQAEEIRRELAELQQ